MKKPLLVLTATITSISAATSIYLATLENPTDIQKQLSTTVNSISVAGTTAIFGLLDDNSDDSNVT
ncbi:hypothetical protein IQ249_17695 [Lusitaniella coriacea LEGE 07157]|uniref:Uncharacterized protein n=1 Tax=Lusitaniella coriacea LEGE 07157 TaxID=945747 RepID=A0A8J7E2R4_9CYAN|nr:hypothetical protein [Lusitaniella coriacea]MBE9117734.1 hypothetical protein [Lusitaniella coriacea LEGE 07157]